MMKRKFLLSLAMMLGFLSFSLSSFAQSWTAEKDGIYLLYNQSVDKFVVRAGAWGTQAVMRNYGVAVKVSTNEEGVSTFTFRDTGGTLFPDKTEAGTWLYCDNTRDNGFTIEDVAGEEGVYYIKSNAANSYLANSEGNLVTTATATDKWCFVKGDAVEAIYNAKQLNMLKAVVTSAGLDATKVNSAADLTGAEGLALETIDVTSQAGFPSSRGEAWQPKVSSPGYSDLLTLSLNAPVEGLYKIQFPAMYRTTWNATAVENANAGVDYANVYLKNGEYELAIATVTRDATEDDKGDSANGEINGTTMYFPNGQNGFEAWANAGCYQNTIYAYASEANQKINVTLRYEMGNPNQVGQWAVWNPVNAKMYQLVDLSSAKAGLATLIATAEDLLDQPHETELDADLEDAIEAAKNAKNSTDINVIATATTNLSNALGAVDASVKAYAKVQAAWEAAELIVAYYDEPGNAAYNAIVNPIKAAYNTGMLVTSECDSKIADINNAIVEAAKATVQPKDNADMTVLLVNPSFERDMAGWVNNQMAIQTNNSFGKTGNKYAEFWQPNGTKGVKQTVKALPQGYYAVTVAAKARGLESAEVFANEGKTAMTIADEQNDYTANTVLMAGADLVFGVNATGTGASASWIAIDNFRLTYVRALTEEEIEANRLANEEEIAAYNAAVEAIEGKLGFEAGEYAPYKNVEALTALAAAKVDAAQVKATAVVAATEAIKALELTAANEAEINAIYDGTFAEYAYAKDGTNEQPIGWTGDANHDTPYNVRHVYYNSSNTGLSATSSQEAMFIKFGASYGKVAGYTMPLKANKNYTLTFKYGGYNELGKRNLTVTTPAGETIALNPKTVTAKDNKAHTTPESWAEYIGDFTTAEAGNYVLNFEATSNSQNQLVFGDIVLVKTSNEALAMRDYAKWEALCGQLTAAMAGNEEYILPDTRMAIETFQSEDVYPTMIQAALDEANEAGTQYVTPFDWATVEALVADLIANINGVKNGEIPLYTETGVVGDGTANKAMPFFNTTADVEVYANNTIVLKGWDGVKGSDLKVAYNKLDQNGETVLAIAGIEQTVNGEVVSEVNDETEDTYVVLYPQSTVYPMVAVEVAHEMTGLMLGDEEMPAMGTLSLYGHFYKAANVGGEDDNIGVAEPIEAAYMISWPGERILQEDFDVPAGTDLAEYINDNKVLFGEAAILNLEEGDYTMSKAVEIPAGTAVMLAGNGAKLTLSEGASFVMNDGIVLENLTINAAALGNAALIKMGSAPVKQEGQNGQIVENPVSIKNCTINDLPSYIYSDGGKAWIINDFSIENSVIKLNTTDADLKGQALIRANGYGMVSLVIAESTIYNVGEASAAGKYLIQYNNAARADRMGAEMAYVIFRNNTFYNTWSAGGQLANYGGIAGKETTTLTMTDNIFVGMPDIARRFVGNNVGKATVTFANNTYQKADGTYDNASNYDKSGTAIECDPGFENAAEGNFTLSNVSEQAKFQTGDPRWLVEYDAVLAAALADKAKLEAMQADLTQFIAGKDEYITADIRQSIETILGDSWVTAINGAYEDAVEKGTEYVSPDIWNTLETQIAWVKEQIEGIMNGTIALYTEAGVVTDGTVNKAMPFFNTPVNVEVYANNTVVLKGWDGVEGSDLKVVYAKVGTLNEADDVEPRTVIIGLEQTVNGEVVSVPQENEDGEVESVTLIPQAGKYSAFDVQLGEEMTSAMIGEGEETGYGVVSLLGAWYPKAAPAEGDELGDNMGVEPAVAALYMVQWPAEPIVLTYTLAELAELPATEEAVKVKVELEGAKVTAAFDMEDYIVAFVEDETAAVQVAAAEIEAGKALTGVVNGTWADYGNGAVLMITENNATAEDVDVKTGQEIVEPNELLNPYNVNRLVTVYNSMMCPIVNEEGMLRIGDMVNVYDVFYVLGEEYELPAYIISVTGVLVPMMNNVVLVPRSAADIVGSNQDPNAINNATANNGANGAIYNLSGQKVNANFKGVMIKNGKKVNVK